MSRRLEVELTSKVDDSHWTWRAAGARQPKGTLDSSILSNNAKVGDVLKVEADFDIDGITILSVVPQKAKKAQSQVLEIKGPSKVAPDVTTSLKNQKPARSAKQGRPKVDSSSSRASKPSTRPNSSPSRRPSGPKPETRPDTEQRPITRPKRLTPANTHKNEVLASLSQEEKPIAEQLLRGGIPAVRQAIEAQNKQSQEKGEPLINPDPIMAIAERILPKIKTATWKDRAEAAIKIVDEIGLRDLRAVVSSADTRDEQSRELASQLRNRLETRLKSEQDKWVASISSNLEEGRLVRALRLSSRPVDLSMKLPSDLAVKLGEASSKELSEDTPPERWLALLEAVANSPIRRNVKPVGLPKDPTEQVIETAKRTLGRVPGLAPLLGVAMPPPPGPKVNRPKRRPPQPSSQSKSDPKNLI